MAKDYNDIRYRLFGSTYVGHKVVEFIRSKYKIDRDQKSTEWVERLYHEERNGLPLIYSLIRLAPGKVSYNLIWSLQDELTDLLIPEIRKLASYLNFPAELLMLYVIYDNVPKNINQFGNYYISNEIIPITEKGVYVKVDANSTLAEIKDKFRGAKKMALALALVSKNTPKKNTYKKKRVPRINLTSEEKESRRGIVVLVEKEIKNMIENEETDEYKGVVLPAIERVAGNLVGDTSSEKEFREKYDQLQRRVKTIYYATLREYSLPKYKDLRAILDFISS